MPVNYLKLCQESGYNLSRTGPFHFLGILDPLGLSFQVPAPIALGGDVMKRILGVVAVLLTVVLLLGVWADSGWADSGGTDSGGDGAVRQNQTARGGRPALSLQEMLTNAGLLPKPVPVAVSFSHSWVDAQPKAKGDEQWRCLSEALYFEARGETVRGQFAVAEVIMNRAKSSRFPGTLCGVIKQGTGRKYQCQFTYTCDGYKDIIAEHQAYERVSKVARAIIDGAEGTGNLTEGATHYHTSAVHPAWAKTYRKTARIGVHLFYRHNYRTAQSE